jgi:diguanylate cyclase (GGDEF)-like protein
MYAAIVRRGHGPRALAGPACVQISGLTNRGLTAEAVNLSLDLLARLGIDVPDRADIPATLDDGLDELYRWVGESTLVSDVRRAELSNPDMMAAARLINHTMPPAFFGDQTVMAWLVMQARRLWDRHGPHAALVGPLCHACVVTIARREDYRTGYGAVHHVLSVSEARGYEPETSQARFLFSVSTCHWFEPLEDSVVHAQRAHEGLVKGGDLQYAGFTYHTSTASLLDCSPTVDSYAGEVEAGITFATRTGNDQTVAGSLAFRQLVRALRGETHSAGGFDDDTFTEAEHVAAIRSHPMAAAHYHAARALAAAVFADADALIRHSAAAMPLLPFIQSHYATSRAYLLRALALAAQARGAGSVPSGGESELDACRAWLAARAGDAPGNFAHLVCLVDAERDWAHGRFRAAAGHFDAALREVAQRQRPWHRALITERAAAFHLEHGLEYVGRHLLSEALRHYRQWGATAKVADLVRRHPFLTATANGPAPERDPFQTIGVPADTVDLLGVLKASQALSSETNLDRLRARVAEVLSEMTGATAVRVALRDDGSHGWYLPGSGGGPAHALTEAGARGLVPLSAFRFAERTRAPLLVSDATHDDRFARDPYLAGLDRCSLLVVPILTHGEPRAMLLLENRLSGSAFSTDRLDAVNLIAGQLAVCLDNAMLYASLEHKVAERTEELAAANERLELLSITDPLTGLANRRRMAHVLQAEWLRSQRSGAPIGVAMVDIDNFKAFNDHYGHIAGDACLRRVAAALSESVRGTDLVARYGGEEFAIILPGADLATAHTVAERARAAVAGLAEPHTGSACGWVTVSIGVAAIEPAAGATTEQLIKQADAELYRAKRAGRNRISGVPPRAGAGHSS